MSEITKEQLMEIVSYMANQITVPTIGLGGGFAPIGTIISYMGVSAPQDYLICDGQIYDIADYSDLADFFESQFGSKNNFGGDGTTTFAVPDLRGEFLRGSGANSHPRSGDGADVGIHQEGTMNPFTMVLDNATNNANQIAVDPTLSENPNSSATHWWGAANTDYKSMTNNKLWRNPTTTSGSVDNSGMYPSGYVARPTNTSVLYCIKARGKYDITRPDLWPANEEIYFGEGLYGYHAIGGPIAKATQKIIVGNVLKLVSYGGQADRFLDGFPHQMGGANYTFFYIAARAGTAGNLSLYSNTDGVNVYDVWATYYKGTT